jgi:hypothetical protein
MTSKPATGNKNKTMGAPHNIKRYGEVWPEFRIRFGLEILEKLK